MPTREKRPRADLTQPSLPGLGQGVPSLVSPLDHRQGVADEAGDASHLPVECLWGCRGTPTCLCGQGELSDDPVWIEND
jgi:hypothetical protein